jgi:hypothetical protein
LARGDEVIDIAREASLLGFDLLKQRRLRCELERPAGFRLSLEHGDGIVLCDQGRISQSRGAGADHCDALAVRH